MRLFIFSDEARKIFLKEVWNINIEEIGNRRARIFPQTIVVAESLLIVRFGKVVQSVSNFFYIDVPNFLQKNLPSFITKNKQSHDS
jgi:hypothetical protein